MKRSGRCPGLLASAVFALGSALGCGSCRREPGLTSTPDVDEPAFRSDRNAVLAPEPAPDGLLAELYVATPDKTWGRWQRGVGGAVDVLPMSLGGLVCAFAGLDAAFGREIDGAAPLVGVFADGPDVDPRAGAAWALAMRLVEPRHARGRLFDAEDAKYTGRAAGTMTQLIPRGGRLPVSAAIGAGGFLVLAGSDAALARLGPYAYRTLGTRGPVAEGEIVVDVPRAALAGALRARVTSAWNVARADLARKDDAARARHGGRAPDFGDPRAILASIDALLAERLAVLGDSTGARLLATVDADAVHADLTLTPSPGGGAAQVALAAMHPGDAIPLLAQPDSPVAILLRDDASGRAQTAGALEAAVREALGPRLAERERTRLHAALQGWSAARGDWVTVGLLGMDGVSVRAPLLDQQAAARAVRDALDLAQAPPLRDALGIRQVKPAPFGATITYGEGKSAELGWTVEEGEFRVLLQGPSRRAPSARVPGDAPSAPVLGDAPPVASALRGLEGVTFAAVLQPLAFDAARAALPPAPIIVGWGKKGDSVWGHLDVSHALAREVLRARAGL